MTIELTDWKPRARNGTLVIKQVQIINESPQQKLASSRALPKGEKGRVLRMVAWLCRETGLTTLAAVRDLYIQVVPKAEPTRDLETGEPIRTKDGVLVTKDERRKAAGVYANRLAGDGWIEIFGGETKYIKRLTAFEGRRNDVPPDWVVSDPAGAHDPWDESEH